MCDSREELILEGFGILGMYAEMRAKAALLQQKIEEEKKHRTMPSLELQMCMDHFFKETEVELDKYDTRLDEINEELEQYDVS